MGAHWSIAAGDAAAELYALIDRLPESRTGRPARVRRPYPRPGSARAAPECRPIGPGRARSLCTSGNDSSWDCRYLDWSWVARHLFRCIPSSTFPASNTRRGQACFRITVTDQKYPDLPFTPAVLLLLTRVVSPARPKAGSVWTWAIRLSPPTRLASRVRLLEPGRRSPGAPQRRAPGHRNRTGGKHRDRNAAVCNPDAHLPNRRTAPEGLCD